jgi:hypothetical protein
MTTDRSLTLAPALQAGKAASKALVRAFGGQEASRLETGKSQSRVCSYGLPNTADFMPIDVVHALEASTHGTAGHPHVTRWLAREAGFELVPLPSAEAPAEQWNSYVAKLGRDAGCMIEGICTDLGADNDVTPADARRRLPDADDLVRVAVELRAALLARAGE